MIPSEYLTLINKAKEATTKRKVRWSSTSDANKFKLDISSYTIMIQSYDSFPDDCPMVSLELLNFMGERIDGIYIEVTDEGYGKLQELYALARRNALHIDETISELMTGLDDILK